MTVALLFDLIVFVTIIATSRGRRNGARKRTEQKQTDELIIILLPIVDSKKMKWG